MPREKNRHQPFDWPLSGKLNTSVDPLLLGEGDYRQLTNMRYTDKGIRGVRGMTKINASPTEFTNIDNGFFFKKDQPELDYVLAQTTSGSNSRIVISNTNSNVPGQDTFSNLVSLANNNRVYFSDAPNGAAVACNGESNYIYGGSETPTGKFVVYDTERNFSYDYSDVVSNTLDDSNNIATMFSSASLIDSNTKLLLHLDNNVTDSSASPQTVTNNNVTFDSTIYRFGGYSGSFNGTNAYLSIPDSASFDFSGGTWTVSGQIYVTAYPSGGAFIYYQDTTSLVDSLAISLSQTGQIRLDISAASSLVVSAITPPGTISTNAFHHFLVTESGDNYYIFIDGLFGPRQNGVGG